uniref:Odorant-binding protein n=1 Tax=Galeruca daurica TaxID=1651263 RepID=A0A1U9W507_9CUCU|nr:odorant-binding protein [Galeruca daurica]
MRNLTALLIVAIVCFANAELTEEQREKLREHNKECSAESGVNPDVIKLIKEGGEFPDDEKLKTHVVCLAKKIGFMNDAGEVQPEVIREKIKAVLGDKALTEIMEACTGATEKDADTTFQKVQCFLQKAQKHFITS